MVADSPAADSVLSHFRWIDGDADTWEMLRDPDALATIVGELAMLCAADAPDVIESAQVLCRYFAGSGSRLRAS